MMNKCAVEGVACIGHAAGVRVEFLQGAGQCVGIAGEVRASGVGLIFARARNGKLNQAAAIGATISMKRAVRPPPCRGLRDRGLRSRRKSWPSVPCWRAW